MVGANNVFYGLSPRLTVLLGTIFTQEGEQDLYITDYLTEEDSYLIKEKAAALLELDGPRRAALVAAEMRRQFQFRGLLGLDQVDPTWILSALKGEQPVTIGIILAQLSASTRSRIMAQLPDVVRARVPSRDELKGTRLEIMRAVRQIFEAKFVTMPVPPTDAGNFYFKDIALLEGRELMQLVRALGLEELGAAFLTVGKRKLAELCTRLGREAAEELVAAVKQTEERDAMDMKDANSFLQRMLLGLRLDEARGVSPDEAKERFQRELFQKAGLLRLAKACRSERPSFVQQLAQRLPRTHGRLFQGYVSKIGEIYDFDDVKLRRLQDLVLYRVEKLAARGKVNPRYLKFTFCYWGDDGAAAEGEGEPAPEAE
ncbi:MAG: hypothetical protein U1E65_15470 [Myxococcota bacterium]